MSESKILIVAEYIAEMAHSGQVDKAGVDYIEHPSLQQRLKLPI